MSTSEQSTHSTKGNVLVFLGGLAAFFGLAVLADVLQLSPTVTPLFIGVTASALAVVYLYEGNRRDSWLLGLAGALLGANALMQLTSLVG
jgi:uncharacterized membrane protein YadS